MRVGGKHMDKVELIDNERERGLLSMFGFSFLPLLADKMRKQNGR